MYADGSLSDILHDRLPNHRSRPAKGYAGRGWYGESRNGRASPSLGQGVPCVTVAVLPVPVWFTFETLPFENWLTSALLLIPAC